MYCGLHPFDVSDEFVRFGALGVILSGGPNSVYEAEDWRAPQAVVALGVPVLGICYGMQTIASQLGGKVESASKREFGYAEMRAPVLEAVRGASRIAAMTKGMGCWTCG